MAEVERCETCNGEMAARSAGYELELDNGAKAEVVIRWHCAKCGVDIGVIQIDCPKPAEHITFNLNLGMKN